MLAIIPARRGSKRIPGKNIKLLGGKPLIAWTIEAATKSRYIDRIIVSTDSGEITRVAKEWGSEVPFVRPKNLSSDEAYTESVIKHALNWIVENESQSYDYFILLQPTSPLRTEKHIDESIEIIVSDTNADALVSLYKPFKNVTYIKQISYKGYVLDSFSGVQGSVEHQNLAEVYALNGALYICKWNLFLKDEDFYKGNCLPYFMDAESSIDIDTDFDWKLAEAFLT